MTLWLRLHSSKLRGTAETRITKNVLFMIKHCGVADTLPRHLLPKSSKERAAEISAKAALDPRFRSQSDLNPFLHCNRLDRSPLYEQPLTVRLSRTLQISSEKIGKLLLEYPELSSVTDKEAGDLASFLTLTFGGETYMRTMIMREPLLLSCDVFFVQQQIDQIVATLCDHVVDERRCDSNKMQRVQFVLDMIRRQSSILMQNVDGVVVPRIAFLRHHFSAIALTQLLLNLSSVIVMDFHRLIRIAFLRQRKRKGTAKVVEEEANTRKMTEISAEINVNLKDYEIDERHSDLMEQWTNDDAVIPMQHILKLQPRSMAKMFKDYIYWLHDEIESNFYYHPLLAERDQVNHSASPMYSEPILNLIDGDLMNSALIPGQGSRDMVKQRRQIKAIRQQKTIRQLEMLVGDVYRANMLKQSLFRC